MKQIPMNQLLCLAMALPKCTIDSPNDAGCQFIRDSAGKLIGEIHWVLGHISIYENYQYHREAIRAIEEYSNVQFSNRKHFEKEYLEADI